jgi:hypothetical protein
MEYNQSIKVKKNFKPKTVKLLFKFLGFNENLHLLFINSHIRATLNSIYNNEQENNLKRVYSLLKNGYDFNLNEHDLTLSPKLKKLKIIIIRQNYLKNTTHGIVKSEIDFNDKLKGVDEMGLIGYLDTHRRLCKRQKITILRNVDNPLFIQVFPKIGGKIFMNKLYGLEIDGSFFPTMAKIFSSKEKEITDTWDQIASQLRCMEFLKFNSLSFGLSTINPLTLNEIFQTFFKNVKKLVIVRISNFDELKIICSFFYNPHINLSNSLTEIKFSSIRYQEVSGLINSKEINKEIFESLNKLSLKNIYFDDTTFENFLFEFMIKFPNITELKLRNSCLGSQKISLMKTSSFLSNLNRGLIKLDLSNNFIGDDGLVTLTEAICIFHKNTLKLLNISNNKIKVGFAFISKLISNCKVLENLDISLNKFSDYKTFYELLGSIAKNETLTHLNMEHCLVRVKQDYFNQFMNAIQGNTALQILNLSNNFLGNKMINVFKTIVLPNNVKKIILTKNSLTEEGIDLLREYKLRNPSNASLTFEVEGNFDEENSFDILI